MDEPVFDSITPFKLTPNELRVLLGYVINISISTARVDDIPHRNQLERYGLVAKVESPQCNYVITDKGMAWLDRALSTPMPVCRWVWE